MAEFCGPFLTVPPDEMILRRLLAFAYSRHGLYGDDGELQDASEFPWIDYRRMTAKEIEAAITERGMAKLALSSGGEQ